MRVQFVSYGKSGKLPKANFQNMSMERTSPKHILVKAKDKIGCIKNKRDIGNGEIAFNFEMKGKPMDNVRLGRCLFKIELGFIALSKGQQEALSPKFDLAREFIMGNSDFPNFFLVATEIRPRPEIRIAYQETKPGYLFVINIFGIIFMFNLVEKPIIRPNEILKKLGNQKFPLSDDK